MLDALFVIVSIFMFPSVREAAPCCYCDKPVINYKNLGTGIIVKKLHIYTGILDISQPDPMLCPGLTFSSKHRGLCHLNEEKRLLAGTSVRSLILP